MSVVTPYLNHLEAIKGKIPELAKKAVKARYSDIVTLVKVEQLGKGLNSQGLPLAWSKNGIKGTGKYAQRTQSIYNKDKRVSGTSKTAGTPYNFNWTGETLDNTQLKLLGNDAFEIFTISGKQKLLEGIYGEIFKLTDEHNTYVNNEIILPYLYQYILNNMFKV